MTKIVLNLVLLVITLAFKPNKTLLKLVMFIHTSVARKIDLAFIAFSPKIYAVSIEAITGSIEYNRLFATLFCLALLLLYRMICKSIVRKCSTQLNKRFADKSK